MAKLMERILTTIVHNLRLKEGFLIESLLDENNSAIVRDVFGYRYEIKINILGRTQEDRSVKKPHDLDFTEILKSE